MSYLDEDARTKLIEELDHYNTLASQPRNKPILQHLINRGITQETINNYGIGIRFRKDRNNEGRYSSSIVIPQYLNGTKEKPKDAINYIEWNYNEEVRNRLGIAKYMNTPNEKGYYHGFQGLNTLNDSINTIMLIEGVIDFLTCVQELKNEKISVLSLGTSNLTNNQEDELFNDLIPCYRITTIILALDNDSNKEENTGLKNTLELLPMFLKRGFYVRVVEYPSDCKDFNDVLVKHGGSKVTEITRNALTVGEFYKFNRYTISKIYDLLEPYRFRLNEHVRTDIIQTIESKDLETKAYTYPGATNANVRSLKQMLYRAQTKEEIYNSFFRRVPKSDIKNASKGNLYIYDYRFNHVWNCYNNQKAIRELVNNYVGIECNEQIKKSLEKDIQALNVFDSDSNSVYHLEFNPKGRFKVRNGTIYLEKTKENQKKGAYYKFQKDYYSADDLITQDHLFSFYDEDSNGFEVNEHVETFLNQVSCYDYTVKITIIEMLGSFFLDNNVLQKWFYLYGEHGSNGKSTLTHVINKLFGSELVSHMKIEEMDAKRFNTSTLRGKWVNLSSETKTNLKDSEQLIKETFTGGTIQTEEKNQGIQENKISAILCIDSNNLIRSSDKSNGWYRRIQAIPFKANFTSDIARLSNPNTYPINTKIEDELINPNALSYWLYLSLYGYSRIVKNGYSLSYEEVGNDIINELKSKDSTVNTFLSENNCYKSAREVLPITSLAKQKGKDIQGLEDLTHFVINVKDLYKCYKLFCMDMDINKPVKLNGTFSSDVINFYEHETPQRYRVVNKDHTGKKIRNHEGVAFEFFNVDSDTNTVQKPCVIEDLGNNEIEKLRSLDPHGFEPQKPLQLQNNEETTQEEKTRIEDIQIANIFNHVDKQGLF